MKGNRIDRRDLCKSLLALGGVALTGAALDAQQTIPAPGIVDPAALLSPEQRGRESESVQALLNSIVPAVSTIPRIRDEKAKMREAVVANVRLQVQNLKKSKFVQRAVASNRIAVIGAYYEITSGAVDFFITEADLQIARANYDYCPVREHLA